MSIWGKDKSGCKNRHGGLVKKAVEVLKDAKKDNSEVQKEASIKLYKASSIYK